MANPLFQNLFGRLRSRSAEKTAQRKRRKAASQLQSLELLEDRLAPANITWSNGDFTNNWSDPLNWTGGVVPGPSDVAVFNDTGLASPGLVTVDAPQTIGGILFSNSSGNSYTIGGANSLTFSAGATIGSSGNTPDVISAPQVTSAGATLTFDVAPSLTFTDSGVISGAGGIATSNSGTLVLGAQDTYAGATTVNAGTLKLGASTVGAFQYYKFVVLAPQAGVNNIYQISELSYYSSGNNPTNGTRVFATSVPAGAGTDFNGTFNSGEGPVSANDGSLDNGTTGTKLCDITSITSTAPQFVTFNFGTPQIFTGYDWATANDSTPSRNPNNFQVYGSNDDVNFTLLDSETNQGQTPTVIATWANGWNLSQVLVPGPALPTGTVLTIAAGATFDLAGASQTVGGLLDAVAGAGGKIINSKAATPATLTVNTASGTNVTYSGTFTDASASAISIVKSGSGTQALTGSVTYAGATTVNSGTLLLTGTDSLGGAITVTTGNATLSGNVTAPGAITVNSGSLSIAGSDSLAGAKKVLGGSLTLAGTNSATSSATISGGVLNVLSSTALSLSTVTLSGGSLTFDQSVSSHAFTFGGLASTVTTAAIALQDNATTPNPVALTVGGLSGTNSYTGTLTGAGSIIKIGTGTFFLSGANTFTGPVNINAGTLQLGSANALGDVVGGSTTTVASGASLNLNGLAVDQNEIIKITGTGTSTTVGALTNSSSTNASVTQLIVDGSITTSIGGTGAGKIFIGSGSTVTGYLHSAVPGTPFALTKVGSDEFVINISDDPDLGDLAVNAGKFTVATATGIGIGTKTATVASGATLSLSASGALSYIKNVVLNGGGSLSADGTGPVTLGDGTTNTAVTLSGSTSTTLTANVPFTIASLITGAAPVTKSGTSTLTPTYSGDNYTGAVSITAGFLTMPTAAALGAGAAPVTIASGGAIQLASGLSYAGSRPLTIAGSGPSGAGVIESLGGTTSASFAGAIVLNGATTIGADGGTFTLPNNVTASENNLTFVGAGNVVASGNLSSSFYVGFTGGTGGVASTQNILNWTYSGGSTNIDNSAGFGTNALTLNGATIAGGALQLTDGGGSEARSAFEPVTPGSFSSSFQFQFVNPGADGFAFVIQGQAPNAVGAAGGSLGYGGIVNSLGVQFNMYNNVTQMGVATNGTVNSATGILTGGTTTNLFHATTTGTNVTTGTGHVFQVNLSYDGTSVLTVSITDTTANVNTTSMFTVGNIFGSVTNLTQKGTGRVVLSGTDSYTGGTTATSGTLEVDGSLTATSGVTVTNATLSGQGTIAGPVNINGGGVLSPGANGGTNTGILGTGTLTFASGASPIPALNIQINGSAVGTEFDQVNVTGAVNLNNAALNLSVGANVDSDSTLGATTYDFINNDLTDPDSGGFTGFPFGGTININNKAFLLNNGFDFARDGGDNDIGLLREQISDIYVSPSFGSGAFTGTFSDPTLTNGETVTYGFNAFSDVQAAINAFVPGTTTGLFVNPGTYSAVTDGVPAALFIQGGSISITSFDDSSASATRITIGAGSALTLDSDNSSTNFAGNFAGSGSLVKAGTGVLTVMQANPFTGTVEVAGGTLAVGSLSVRGDVGSGAITVDSGALLAVTEPGTGSNPATFASSISGAGGLEIIGNGGSGAVVLSGTNNYTGGLTINGGEFIPLASTAIGHPSSVTVLGAGQFSFGTLTGLALSMPLTLSSPNGFVGANNIAANLLFDGTTNTWAGQISVTGSPVIAVPGGTAKLAGKLTGTGTLSLGAGTALSELFQITNASNSLASAMINSNAAVLLGVNSAPVALATGLITLNNGGTLVFNSSGNTTFAGTIAAGGGSGGTVDIQNSGTLTLASGASVTVGTLGNAATGLNLGTNFGGTAGAGILDILPGATLTDAATFEVGQTAQGSVNQSGGSVSLTGTLANVVIGVNFDTLPSSYSLTGGTLSAPLSNLVVGPVAPSSLSINGTAAAASFHGISLALASSTLSLASGTLAIGSSGLTGSSTVPVGTATLQAIGSGVISTPLSLSGMLTVDSGAFSPTISGVVSGTGGIEKIGTGSLALVATNPFSGGLTINAGTVSGTVAAASPLSLGTGPVTEAGGTLNVAQGTGTAGTVLARSADFGGNGTGWTFGDAYGDGTADEQPHITSDDLLLTPNNPQEEWNSAWFNQKVDVASFDAQFTYAENLADGGSSGFAFVLQNSTSSDPGNAFGGGGGTSAVGGNEDDINGYGYSSIGNSFAVVFNIATPATSGNTNPQGLTFATGGAAPGNFIPFSGGIDLASGPIGVDVAYDGTTVTVTLTQGTNTMVATDIVDIESAVGSSGAFVGFTGATQFNATAAEQDFTNFTYTATDTPPPPPPGPNAVIVPAGSTGTTNVAVGITSTVTMGPLTLGAGATLNVTGSSNFPTSITGFGGSGTGWSVNGPSVSGDVATMTDGLGSEAHSLYYSSPISTGVPFHVDYSYTTSGGADGAAFVIQGQGPTAVGSSSAGSNLGLYQGVMPYVAVEFNIYSGHIEGYAFDNLNSAGANVGPVEGASDPNHDYISMGGVSTDLAGNGVPINVDIVYDGTTLTMTASDTSGNTFTASETINIAAVIGGPGGYIGFSAATGGVASTQSISNFTYNAPTPPPSYGLSFSQTSLSGADTINVANGAFSSGGTLSPGTLSDNGTAATLNLNPAGDGTVSLTAPGTITNGTAVNLDGGTLDLGVTGALGNLAALSVAANGSIVLGANETLGALAGAGAVTLNGNILTVGSTNHLSSTFGGAISDGSASGSLVKASSGSLTLTGAETYTGPTAVSAGSLIVNGSLASSSTVSIAAGGILGGSGSVGSVTNLGVVNPGSPGAPGTLNVDGALTLGTGSLVLDLSNTAADSVNAMGSSVDITGATLSLNVGAITPGEVFTILTVPGTSGGLTGTFNGLDGTSGHDTITAGGTVFTISYTDGDGNDITLTATGTASPSIVSTVLNGGIAYIDSSLAQNQHSMVENVVYSFSQSVSLSAANFTLSGINGTTTAPNVVVSGSGTVWTVTFSGTGVNDATHSIGDGEYSLVLNDAADGLAASTFNFFRLLGDMDGDGTVSAADFSTLVGTFLRATNDPLYLGADDFDGDSKIGASDLSQFTASFLHTVPAPLPH